VALKKAAGMIANYEAARWSIGIVRRPIRPALNQMRTQPSEAEDKAFFLPADLSGTWAIQWAKSQAEEFAGKVFPALSADAIEASFKGLTTDFCNRVTASVDEILVWFSGKDLMIALKPWLESKRMNFPNTFTQEIPNWMREYPDSVLNLLPEWRNLCEVLRS
ncbi:MAG: hypothetical protein NTX50_19935, partial [Candidatus Sumerlaeota bacterium]|nr:hypothetical protein [Candidatus Sumerlaeota bacterium]